MCTAMKTVMEGSFRVPYETPSSLASRCTIVLTFSYTWLTNMSSNPYLITAVADVAHLVLESRATQPSASAMCTGLHTLARILVNIERGSCGAGSLCCRIEGSGRRARTKRKFAEESPESSGRRAGCCGPVVA